jgi:hypothetical protein
MINVDNKLSMINKNRRQEVTMENKTFKNVPTAQLQSY